MARRLKTLAKMINTLFGFDTTITESFCNTDRKAGRLRIPGKGRSGQKLVVYNKLGNPIFEHDTSGTYRVNREVMDWINDIQEIKNDLLFALLADNKEEYEWVKERAIKKIGWSDFNDFERKIKDASS